MKNQITIVFAGRLLAATAVMTAPATAQSGTKFVDLSSHYIAILQGRGYYLQGRGYANDYAMPRARLLRRQRLRQRQQYKSANGIAPQDAEAYNNRGFAKSDLGEYNKISRS